MKDRRVFGMKKVHSTRDLLAEVEHFTFSKNPLLFRMKYVEKTFVTTMSDDGQLRFCDDTQQSENVRVPKSLQLAGFFFEFATLKARRLRTEQLLHGNRT